MLGDSSLLGSSGGGVAGEHDAGGAVGSNSNSGDDEKAGERSFGGNRWPRQETLALLKIRSDMDVAFREASVKGPLWDDVSRKLAELGYHRSAKKCKEKFENVYKYHKRTKEGRGGKPDGKTYRFFEQLEALESHHNSMSMQSLQQKPQTSPPAAAPMSLPHPQVVTIPSAANPIVAQPQIPSTTPFQNADLLSNSSTSTYSDEEAQGRRKKKRKWKDFFERLMKEVIDKQEELQKKFMDAIEKREHERIAREEAWRMQEMARISREREILAQERSMAAAKDSAVMSFLQNVSQQQNPASGAHSKNNSITILPPPPPPPAPTQQPSITNTDNGATDTGTPSSSRWPKVEVEALIQLRTNLDSKYQDNGPKGPLWEEISAGMRRLGYNRSSKRCKEKWENINKYFKKVKESNKKRPQDSKTCPYFHQLDALYRDKHNNNNNYITQSSFLSDQSSAPMMVRPEQQWPPTTTTTFEHHVDRTDQSQADIKLDGTDGDEDDEMEEDEGEDEFELVASKPPSMATE